ncbi:MAG: lactate racemase domain-containing protein [Longimicrobiaceae bacterium]
MSASIQNYLPSVARSVVHIDRRSEKRIIWYGDGFMHERLPVGTRVIYPPPPIRGLPDADRAIRHALNHPEGMEPLHAHLWPGMRVTIAVDDISVPLPIMQRPDVRERVLNQVVQTLADYGVDDIHIIIALSLHRRMTPAEIKRMVGNKVFGDFFPDRLYNHDAEDPNGMVLLGHSRHGEAVTVNRRAAESDLIIYVNLNLVPMDGGHKSVGVGLCDYRTLKAHHTPQAILKSHSYMDPDNSELHHSCRRIGRVIDQELKVFHIETAVNNRMYGNTLSFLGKNEDSFTDVDRAKFTATNATLRRLPEAARREFLMRVPSPYELIAVHAGATEPTHEKILEKSFRQYAVPVEGQADIAIFGIPFVCPYNVNSIMNPLLVQVTALGYLFNLYRGKPLVKKGGTLILCHPLRDEFHERHHPSYIEFFHRLLPETRNSFELQERYEEAFATDPGYIAMYRKGNAYHGVHPFYMWYWGENGREHMGRVIVAGCEQPYVAERMGWEWASTFQEALEMAKDGYHDPQITMLHVPPIGLVDVS